MLLRGTLFRQKRSTANFGRITEVEEEDRVKDTIKEKRYGRTRNYILYHDTTESKGGILIILNHFLTKC